MTTNLIGLRNSMDLIEKALNDEDYQTCLTFLELHIFGANNLKIHLLEKMAKTPNQE